jgi:uncharacterized membrane protein
MLMLTFVVKVIKDFWKMFTQTLVCLFVALKLDAENKTDGNFHVFFFIRSQCQRFLTVIISVIPFSTTDFPS